MAVKSLTRISKKKEPAAVRSSLSIEEQTKAFLAAGGEIEQVSSGISGQPSMAPPKTSTGDKPKTPTGDKPKSE